VCAGANTVAVTDRIRDGSRPKRAVHAASKAARVLLLGRPMRLLACVGLLAAASGCGGCDESDPIDPDPGSGGTGGATASASSSSASSTASSSSTGGAGGDGGVGGQPPGPPPPIPPLVEDAHGLVPAGPITFDIPDNTLGFTAVARVPTTGEIVGFYSLEAPDGALLVNEFVIEGTSFGFIHLGAEAMNVPMTDDAQAMPPMTGTWTVFPYADSGEVDLSIWRRQTLDGAFHGGVIDVNVFIVADAVTEAYALGVIDEAFDDFAGLGVGTVTFSTLPDEFSVLDDTNYLAVLEETAGAAGKPAVNLVYTHDLSNPGALGYSASAPGLPLVHGTQISGLVMIDSGQSKDALTLRHEMGHFAGLSHTSEAEPGVGDRLGDTPFCDNVNVQQLGCPDVDYLLFPYAIPGSRYLVSPLQTKVIQASPIYRGAVEPGGGYAEPLGRAPVDEAVAIRAERARSSGGVEAVDVSWQGRHAMSVARFASAHWCGHHAAGAPAPDPLALLRGLASDAELWSLAADAGAPPYVRARAMRAAGRGGLDAAKRAALVGWTQDAALPRAVRAGALRALAGSGSALPVIAGDPVLARIVERLR
jgi:hypothetical protein